MRRFDKKNHINTLNKKLNESNTIKESDVYGDEEWFKYVLDGNKSSEEDVINVVWDVNWEEINTIKQHIEGIEYVDSKNDIDIYHDEKTNKYYFTRNDGSTQERTIKRSDAEAAEIAKKYPMYSGHEGYSEEFMANQQGYDDNMSLMRHETSSNKALGAAKKMWDTQNGGDMYDNPRAKKMLQTYGEKLLGLKLFGNEINNIDVTLAKNKKDNDGVRNVHELMISIITSNRNSNNTEKLSSIWYNYSTDQFMSGGQVTNLQLFTDEVSKFDARQLYKVAAHFNPDTRYKQFTRELKVSVDEVVDGERDDYDYVDGDAYHNGDMNEVFIKLCGINILK
jgi:hypothetical protein